MKKYKIGNNDYSCIFSFPLEPNMAVDLSILESITRRVGSAFIFTGRIEIYSDDSIYNFTEDKSSVGMRLLRIGVATTAKTLESRRRITDYFQGCFENDFIGVSPASELSEAATVGTMRSQLNPLLIADFENGK